MARYQTTVPAYIDGRYIYADRRHPAVIELPDHVPPSRQFLPLDKAAQAALEKLGVKKAIPAEPSRVGEKKAEKRPGIGEL